jgi:hypothetical protein
LNAGVGESDAAKLIARCQAVIHAQKTIERGLAGSFLRVWSHGDHDGQDVEAWL